MEAAVIVDGTGLLQNRKDGFLRRRGYISRRFRTVAVWARISLLVHSMVPPTLVSEALTTDALDAAKANRFRPSAGDFRVYRIPRY
jgi:hypothetical protein